MPALRPIEGGHLLTWEQFVESVRAGNFIDYDGFGELATETEVSRAVVKPSTVDRIRRPKWATHVVWYNK